MCFLERAGFRTPHLQAIRSIPRRMRVSPTTCPSAILSQLIIRALYVYTVRQQGVHDWLFGRGPSGFLTSVRGIVRPALVVRAKGWPGGRKAVACGDPVLAKRFEDFACFFVACRFFVFEKNSRRSMITVAFLFRPGHLGSVVLKDSIRNGGRTL